MFSVYYCSCDDVTCTRNGLQHTCSIYFSAHCVSERDKTMLVVLAGVTVRPEKAWEKAVRASQGTMLHQGTCMLLRSPYFATLVLRFRPDCTICICTEWTVFANTITYAYCKVPNFVTLAVHTSPYCFYCTTASESQVPKPLSSLA